MEEGSQLFDLLKAAVDALHRLATSGADLIEQRFEPAAKYQLSRTVMKRDATHSLIAGRRWHSSRSEPGIGKSERYYALRAAPGHFLLEGVLAERIKGCNHEEQCDETTRDL